MTVRHFNCRDAQRVKLQIQDAVPVCPAAFRVQFNPGRTPDSTDSQSGRLWEPTARLTNQAVTKAPQFSRIVTALVAFNESWANEDVFTECRKNRQGELMETVPQDTQIRDASTVILLRDRTSNPRILVGQRGEKAVFMPNLFVFPGGGVEPGDAELQLAGRPGPQCLRRLKLRCGPDITDVLLACAVREVWEETGIRLARRRREAQAELPAEWSSFGKGGYRPSAEGLAFVYRAITPPGRTRRFDARFFLADLDKADLAGDPDDFSCASSELSRLQWIPLADAFDFNIPSITRLVVATVSKLLADGGDPSSVPFRFSRGGQRVIEWL